MPGVFHDQKASTNIETSFWRALARDQFPKVWCCTKFAAKGLRKSKGFNEHRKLHWLVVEPPLWKIWVRQLGLLFPIYEKIKFMFQTTNKKKCTTRTKRWESPRLSRFLTWYCNLSCRLVSRYMKTYENLWDQREQDDSLQIVTIWYINGTLRIKQPRGLLIQGWH